MHFYVGTYIHSKDGKTIYKCSVDDAHANIIAEPFIKAGPHPSFICRNTHTDHLYAVNELDKDTDGYCGSVRSFTKNTNGTYTQDSEMSTHGNYPCHLALHPQHPLLFVVNYGSSSLCVYSLDPHGKLHTLIQRHVFSEHSIHPTRQESSHPHQVLPSPCGNYVFVSDLGGDCIHVFSVHMQEQNPVTLIERIPVPKGRGPRHMAFDDTHRYLYVSCELSSSVVVFHVAIFHSHIHAEDSLHKTQGTLQYVQECPAFCNEANPYPQSSAAEIAYYKNHVYMSIRGDDSIAVFTVQENGLLHHNENIACEGNTPRHFKILPLETWKDKSIEGLLVVAHQDSDNLVYFSIENTIESTTENTMKKDVSLVKCGECQFIPAPSMIL